jgi:hypothetical protein
MKAPLNFPVSDIIAAIGVIMASVEVFDHTQGARKDHKQLSDKFIRLKLTRPQMLGKRPGYRAHYWTVSDSMEAPVCSCANYLQYKVSQWLTVANGHE